MMSRCMSIFSILFVAILAGAIVATAQTLNFGSTGEPRTLDVQDAVGVENLVTHYCYDRLVEAKMVEGTLTVLPGLAERWEVSEDARQFTFYLRRGVQFIDGHPLDADAVKFSFDRLFALGLPASGHLDFISNYEVVDEYTIAFRSDVPFVPGIISFAATGASIVSPGIRTYEEESGDWARDWMTGNTAGTGPFVVAEWTRGMRTVLVRNDDYWGEMPVLEKVIIRYIPESSTLRLMLEAGDIDMGESFTAEEIGAMGKNPAIKVVTAPSNMVYYLYLNNKQPYLEDVRVRRAISYAIDYEGILEYVWGGNGSIMQGVIPAGMLGHCDSMFQYTRDLEEARQLLEEAGYPGGGFSLRIQSADLVPEWRQISLVVQQNLADIGIDVVVEDYPNPTHRERLGTGNFDISNGRWFGGSPEPHVYVGYWFDSDKHGLAGNRSFYTSPVMDELVAMQARETDPARREQILETIQWLALSDAPYVLLFQDEKRQVMRTWVQGYEYNPAYSLTPNFPEIWLDK